MLIGYSRISTDKQVLDSQLDELKKAGCKKIFTDIISGSKKEREGLKELLEYARAGDIIVVYRLGRSLKDLIHIMNQFEERKLGFKSLTEHIDTTTPIGKLVFQISGAFAEFERNIIRQRTQIGLKAARARGRLGGRPTKMTPDKIRMAKVEKKLSKDTFKELEFGKFQQLLKERLEQIKKIKEYSEKLLNNLHYEIFKQENKIKQSFKNVSTDTKKSVPFSSIPNSERSKENTKFVMQ